MSTWTNLRQLRITPFSRRLQKGYVFALTIVVLVVLIALGITSINLAIQARDISFRKQTNAQALALAEAGAWVAKATIESGYATAQPPQDGYTFTSPSLSAGGKFSYIQTQLPPPSNDPWLPRWQITSTGTTIGNKTAIVIVQMRPINFGKYAYFENKELSGGWMINGMCYTGPVHSNDTNGLNIYWDKSTGNPIFTDLVESSGTKVNWWDSSHTPQSASDWTGIFKLGQPALLLNAKNIPLPATSRNQQYRSWVGGMNTPIDITGKTQPAAPNPAFPTTTGVYLNNTGNAGSVAAGIYIAGSVDHLVFSIASTGDQVINITQGNTVTAVDVNPVSKQTTLTVTDISTNTPGTPKVTTLSGIPNGLIYSTGNINGVHGLMADNRVTTDSNGNPTAVTYRNSWTVAAEASTSNITLDGNLKYNTTPNLNATPTDPSNLKSASLGIYAQNVYLGDDTLNYLPADTNAKVEAVRDPNLTNDMTPVNGILPCTNRVVNAVVMAATNSTGQWQASDPGYTYNGQPASMTLTGGVINYQAGNFGTFDPGSGKMLNGYAEHYAYDPRMDAFPPPFFPTTLTYQIDSWQQK